MGDKARSVLGGAGYEQDLPARPIEGGGGQCYSWLPIQSFGRHACQVVNSLVSPSRAAVWAKLIDTFSPPPRMRRVEEGLIGEAGAKRQNNHLNVAGLKRRTQDDAATIQFLTGNFEL